MLDPLPNGFQRVKDLVAQRQPGQIPHPLEVLDDVVRVRGVADLRNSEILDQLILGHQVWNRSVDYFPICILAL